MIYDNFVKWLSDLDLTTVDANPITFNLSDFEEVDDFTKSMFLAGRYLLKEDDIVVRYHISNQCVPSYRKEHFGYQI